MSDEARIAAALGTEVDSLRPLGGGSFGHPYAVHTGDGRRLFAKVAPASMVASEAAGLRRLAEPFHSAGGAAVPDVVAVADDVLVVTLVNSTRSSRLAAAAFGVALARTHRSGADSFGAPEPTYLASETLPGGQDATDWPSFYATARLLPFLKRAEAAGNVAAGDAQAVRRLADRLPAVAGPPEPPALLHGDLWSGNVLWTDRDAVMIDPACYGGHRETDLAMLALFGLPHLEVVLNAYDNEFPLAAGWRARVPLHQVFPLLVHALLFGGSYGAAAGDAARHALSAS